MSDSEHDYKSLFLQAATLLEEREFSTRFLKSYVRTECLTCGASRVGHNPPLHKEDCKLHELLMTAYMVGENERAEAVKGLVTSLPDSATASQ